jgi:hypothetical protein
MGRNSGTRAVRASGAAGLEPDHVVEAGVAEAPAGQQDGDGEDAEGAGAQRGAQGDRDGEDAQPGRGDPGHVEAEPAQQEGGRADRQQPEAVQEAGLEVADQPHGGVAGAEHGRHQHHGRGHPGQVAAGREARQVGHAPVVLGEQADDEQREGEREDEGQGRFAQAGAEAAAEHQPGLAGQGDELVHGGLL